jgi:hypothetical protein
MHHFNTFRHLEKHYGVMYFMYMKLHNSSITIYCTGGFIIPSRVTAVDAEMRVHG